MITIIRFTSLFPRQNRSKRNETTAAYLRPFQLRLSPGWRVEPLLHGPTGAMPPGRKLMGCKELGVVFLSHGRFLDLPGLYTCTPKRFRKVAPRNRPNPHGFRPLQKTDTDHGERTAANANNPGIPDGSIPRHLRPTWRDSGTVASTTQRAIFPDLPPRPPQLSQPLQPSTPAPQVPSPSRFQPRIPDQMSSSTAIDTLGVTGSSPVAPNDLKPNKPNGLGNGLGLPKHVPGVS